MRTALALLVLTVPTFAEGSANNYCLTSPNSTGMFAHISYVGSLNVADGDFCLTVTGCPHQSGSFGMFACGQAQSCVPFGNGFQCIQSSAPGIHRMPAQHLGASVITLSMLEHPSAFAMIQPGSEWNFQFWYRNPAASGATFNSSDALHVQFGS